MMESSAKTSSSDHSAFISTAHLLPDSTACRWIAPHQLAAADRRSPMFCRHSTGINFNLNNEDEEDQSVDEWRGNAEAEEIPKVPMFEKPLTPSDVGKLNRLVIPKQHAEKYFPLNGGSDSGESGMLLNFEDETGKLWRFRYSYWSSSQSYVLTKGWSRFVKEKKLDAGDVVVFSRHLAEPGRVFIGWRRRDSSGAQDGSNVSTQPAANGSGWSRTLYLGNPNRNQGSPSLPHQPDCNRQAAGSSLRSQTTSACGNSKRLRLFGVNLECLADDSDSATRVQQQHPYHQYLSDHMETTFSGAEGAYRQG